MVLYSTHGIYNPEEYFSQLSRISPENCATFTSKDYPDFFNMNQCQNSLRRMGSELASPPKWDLSSEQGYRAERESEEVNAFPNITTKRQIERKLKRERTVLSSPFEMSSQPIDQSTEESQPLFMQKNHKQNTLFGLEQKSEVSHIDEKPNEANQSSFLDKNSKNLLLHTIPSPPLTNKSTALLEHGFFKPDTDTLNLLRNNIPALSPNCRGGGEIKSLTPSNSLFNFSPRLSRRESYQSNGTYEPPRPLDHKCNPNFERMSPLFQSFRFPDKPSHCHSPMRKELEELNSPTKNIASAIPPQNHSNPISFGLDTIKLSEKLSFKRDISLKESTDENKNAESSNDYLEFPSPSPCFLSSHRSFFPTGFKPSPRRSRYASLTLDSSLFENDGLHSRDDAFGESPTKKVKKK